MVLTEEAVTWFQSLTTGQPSGSLLLKRAPVRRTTRKDIAPSNGWADHDQKPFMAMACEAARLEPLGFHELRHSYASSLVNRGVPLAYVSAQLGHKDTRMVERYYGHLCPSAMADAIRKAAPMLGTAGEAKLKPQKIRNA